ncbi:MAG: FAD-dependent oxidoreductase [Lachnospiraceae bacterium]|nr:FAD-dependent oxidoreductase [Lachnospiraceae bacterium]
MEFTKLLEKAKMGPLSLDNRLIMAPMGSLNADSNGYITDNALAFYSAQASGGLAMVIVECTATDDDLSRGEDNVMCLYENGQITGMARLASAIQDQGALAILQLCHIGHQLSLADRKESLGPSTMFEMQGGIKPFPIRGLTIAEIDQIIDDFAKAAWRAKMAGFDGIEIHGAIGHLINMFCSPQYNHRTDEYGGSPENRIRFMVEIIEACKKSCGKDFPIIGRICGDSFDPRDISLEEGIIHAKALEKTGIVALHLVGGDSNNVRVINAQYDKRGDYIPTAKAMKEAGVKIPIILDGGFTTPELAEEVLEAGYADFIGIGRPALADPAWIKKIRAGKREDIVPCMRCTMGCVGTIAGFNAAIGLRCSVNPLCNTSNFRKVMPAEEKKNICIIGGGPAGMEAAKVAAQRGHTVTMYEKRKLGGTMHEAAFSEELKGDIRILIDYYAAQMKKPGITVIEEEATAEKVLAGNYDAVIVATGAVPVVTKYEKQGLTNVCSIHRYCSDPSAVEVGQNVVIVGGCFMNLEVAQSLLRAGKKVTVASRRGTGMLRVMELGDDNSSPQQQRLMILNAMKGLQYKLGKDIAEVKEDGVVLRDVRTKQEETLPCDTVLICRGYTGKPKIYEELCAAHKEVYLIGDSKMTIRCNDKRNIGDAILEGWQVGNRI